MRVFANAAKSVTGLVFSLTLLSGCAINMPVPIKDPVPSEITYTSAGSPTPVALSFKNDQTETDKTQILSGRIPMKLVYQGQPFDAVPWVAQHTVKEMVARGLPVTLVEGTPDSTSVLIKRLHIENHRVSGFSPFVTFTSLRADVITPRGPQRITAYIKRGKVPVWSFDEVIDPTYNDPLAILTKELAAKLNQALIGQVVSDEQVNVLIDRIKKDSARPDAYLDVYQLGFSNNPIAIPELVKLSLHTSEYVRLAALSSLGILKANDQFDFLAKRYESKDGLWQDRAMALKAIGDMDTPQSRAYLQKALTQFENSKERDVLWTTEIILLYL